MNLTKKITTIFLALALATMAASCSSDKKNGDETEATTTAVTTAAVEVNPFADSQYSTAMTNVGDYNNLLSAMKKAENGEKVVISTIGGSITQGSSTTNIKNCYAELFFAWWKENFPTAQFEFVNAGIGGTDSYLGVHRADNDLLSQNPDVVIVEYSVNDSDPLFNKYSYDSLVRKILSDENNPAVMLLFTTMDNGHNLQEVHSQIGNAYNLPMLSYRDYIIPKIQNKEVVWADISPDNIHPDDDGHKIIGDILYTYLDFVKTNLADFEGAAKAFETEAFTSDYYANAKFLSAADISDATMENVEVGSNNVYPKYNDNFVSSANGVLEFTVNDCENLGIFYLKKTDGSLGSYDIYIDGEFSGKLDGDFTGGWGNYGVTTQFMFKKDKGTHTVKIMPTTGNDDKGFVILRVMTS